MIRAIIISLTSQTIGVLELKKYSCTSIKKINRYVIDYFSFQYVFSNIDTL